MEKNIGNIKYQPPSIISPDHCALSIALKINTLEENLEIEDIEDIIVEKINTKDWLEKEKIDMIEKMEKNAEIQLAKDLEQVNIESNKILLKKIYNDAITIVGKRRQV